MRRITEAYLKVWPPKLYRRKKLTEAVFISGEIELISSNGPIRGADAYVMFDLTGFPYMVPKAAFELIYTEPSPAEAEAYKDKIEAESALKQTQGKMAADTPAPPTKL